ncbi:hypothetical protein LW89_01585 [Salmonella enterica subsp. enterica serovar Paratyphi A]|nr:hypothetical protein LW89_01585 [Salmonella enterica subsp. enterica serovar Paratyphi A]
MTSGSDTAIIFIIGRKKQRIRRQIPQRRQWNITTDKTAIARNPSISGLYFKCSNLNYLNLKKD